MCDQGANADNRVIDVLGKYVAHRGANFVIALAVMTIGGREALDVGNCFDIPNDDAVHVSAERASLLDQG
jgi:hypothetical protein